MKASVIQYSAVKGGNIMVDIVVSSRGTLLTRKDRSTKEVSRGSLRKVAFARMSKEAVMSSMAMLWTLDYYRQYRHKKPGVYEEAEI